MYAWANIRPPLCRCATGIRALQRTVAQPVAGAMASVTGFFAYAVEKPKVSAARQGGWPRSRRRRRRPQSFAARTILCGAAPRLPSAAGLRRWRRGRQAAVLQLRGEVVASAWLVCSARRVRAAAWLPAGRVPTPCTPPLAASSRTSRLALAVGQVHAPPRGAFQALGAACRGRTGAVAGLSLARCPPPPPPPPTASHAPRWSPGCHRRRGTPLTA